MSVQRLHGSECIPDVRFHHGHPHMASTCPGPHRKWNHSNHFPSSPPCIPLPTVGTSMGVWACNYRHLTLRPRNHLCTWSIHTFVDSEKNSLLQGFCTHDNCYYFTIWDWQATREVILQAEFIENHFAQQKLLKLTLVYQHNMGGTYVERHSTSDEVKKAVNKLGSSFIREMRLEWKWLIFHYNANKIYNIHNSSTSHDKCRDKLLIFTNSTMAISLE